MASLGDRAQRKKLAKIRKLKRAAPKRKRKKTPPPCEIKQKNKKNDSPGRNKKHKKNVSPPWGRDKEKKKKYKLYEMPNFKDSFFKAKPKKEELKEKVLFISGPARSGNHLLISMLDNHPQIASEIGEDDFLRTIFSYANVNEKKLIKNLKNFKRFAFANSSLTSVITLFSLSLSATELTTCRERPSTSVRQQRDRERTT